MRKAGRKSENHEKKRNDDGFTLVELIVILVILAILAALLIPAMTGYIDKAKRTALIAECRAAVMAAQTTYSEAYGKGLAKTEVETEATIAAIKKLAEVPGTISAIEADDGFTILHLTYTGRDGKSKVVYCRKYTTCAVEAHTALYNFEEGTGSGGDDSTSTPDPGTEPTAKPTPKPSEGLIVKDSEGNEYTVTVNGNLPTGALVGGNKVFYFDGEYYSILATRLG